MSLDKAIAHGKEKRRPYHGSKAFDKTCRNHGSCPWCAENRQHKFRDKKPPELYGRRINMKELKVQCSVYIDMLEGEDPDSVLGCLVEDMDLLNYGINIYDAVVQEIDE